jgi:hypothetical protein
LLIARTISFFIGFSSIAAEKIQTTLFRNNLAFSALMCKVLLLSRTKIKPD